MLSKNWSYDDKRRFKHYFGYITAASAPTYAFLELLKPALRIIFRFSKWLAAFLHKHCRSNGYSSERERERESERVRAKGEKGEREEERERGGEREKQRETGREREKDKQREREGRERETETERERGIVWQ